MNLVVFGATGRTGKAVIDDALRRGHRVVAASRSAAEHPWPAPVVARSVDITDATAVAAVLSGADAAIVTVGIGASRRPTTIYSTGVTNILGAMHQTSSGRVSVVSAVPAAPRDQLPASQRMLVPILSLFFGASYPTCARWSPACPPARSTGCVCGRHGCLPSLHGATTSSASGRSVVRSPTQTWLRHSSMRSSIPLTLAGSCSSRIASLRPPCQTDVSQLTRVAP